MDNISYQNTCFNSNDISFVMSRHNNLIINVVEAAVEYLLVDPNPSKSQIGKHTYIDYDCELGNAHLVAYYFYINATYNHQNLSASF